jgi:integrase
MEETRQWEGYVFRKLGIPRPKGWQKGVSGWLQNKERKQRRDSPNTLTDKQVLNMINIIGDVLQYSRLNIELDRLLRLRDQALLAVGQIFFKRSNEILKLRLGDTFYDTNELAITFTISKKRRKMKVCPSCGAINARKAVVCNQCATSIETTPLTLKGPNSVIVTKRKSLSHPLCPVVVKWIDKLKELQRDQSDFLFPTFKYKGICFGRHLTNSRFNQILQHLDKTLTSSFFRYGVSEQLLKLGYSTYELKVIGDWSSEHMPSVYAARKGFTVQERRFAQDVRVTE